MSVVFHGVIACSAVSYPLLSTALEILPPAKHSRKIKEMIQRVSEVSTCFNDAPSSPSNWWQWWCCFCHWAWNAYLKTLVDNFMFVFLKNWNFVKRLQFSIWMVWNKFTYINYISSYIQSSKSYSKPWVKSDFDWCLFPKLRCCSQVSSPCITPATRPRNVDKPPWLQISYKSQLQKPDVSLRNGKTKHHVTLGSQISFNIPNSKEYLKFVEMYT